MFVLSEYIYFGYFSSTLDVLSLLSIISAIVVITIKNPIASIMCLIALFSVVSFFLISTGLGFIGLAYLLVYVGAVSILFLFILMLINVRVSELISETKNSIPLVFLVTYIFMSANPVVFYNVSVPGMSPIQDQLTIIATQKNWEDTSVVFDHIACIGFILYTVFAALLIVVSLILLLAMVGAIAISVKQKLSNYLVTERIVHSSLFGIFSRDCPKPYTFINVTLQSRILSKDVIIRLIRRLFIVLVTGLIIRSFINSNLFGEWQNIMSSLCFLIFFVRVFVLECIIDPVYSTQSIMDTSQINFMKRPGSPLESGSSKIGRYESPSPEVPAPVVPTPEAPAPELSSPETSDSEGSPSMPASPGSDQGSDRSATQSPEEIPEEGTEDLTDRGWQIVESIRAVRQQDQYRADMEEEINSEDPDRQVTHRLAFFLELAYARTSYNPATNSDIGDHIDNHMNSNEAQARLERADIPEIDPFYLPRNNGNN